VREFSILLKDFDGNKVDILLEIAVFREMIWFDFFPNKRMSHITIMLNSDFQNTKNKKRRKTTTKNNLQVNIK